MGVTSRIAPGFSAAIAEALWFRPMGRPAKEAPYGSQPFSGTVAKARFSGFALGEGDIALLLHGWGGASSDMAPIASALAGAGFKAVAVDLPGHGPYRRSRTDLFQMAAAVNAVSNMFGPPRVVVAHSFGAATAFAVFPYGGPRSVILLAPAIRSERFFDFFGSQLGLAAPAQHRFQARIERYAGPQLMAVMRGEGDIPGTKLLVLHDPEDDRTVYGDSQAFVAERPQAKLIPLPDAGHTGILSNNDAIDEIIRFVQ